jgi:Peptidase inhibitor family I36
MKKLSALALALLFGIALAPQSNAAPQFGRGGGDRVCLYRDIYYMGQEQCYSVGDNIATLQSFSGRTSSIRIYGRAVVMVWDETNFRGHTTMFTESVPDLGQVRLESKSWSDRITSLRVSVETAGVGRPSAPPPPPPPAPERDRYPSQQPREGVCVYERPNYEGRSQCWSGNENLSNLARMGNWNNRIASIRVFGRTSVVVYNDVGYRGSSMIVDRDMPNLAQVSGGGIRDWDRRISSMELQERGRERDRGRFDRDR